MEKIDKQLKEPDIDVKNVVDWDDSDKVEQLSFYLKELQS